MFICHPRWFAPSLLGGIALLSSCAGSLSESPDLEALGSASASAPNAGMTGALPVGTLPVGSTPVGSVSGAPQGMQTASAAPNSSQVVPNPAASSAVDDPYAIPASAPISELVETPRVARLSRQQWSNTVRDLLKLSDISEIDKDVSGDALIGFDSQADALYIGEMLRRELATAAERLADKVTSDPSALERLVPAGAPMDAPERSSRLSVNVHSGVRCWTRKLRRI